jgi:hypothetical protein
MITEDQLRRIRLFAGTGPVWRALHDLEQRLRDSQIPYVIIGGVALNAYNYPFEAKEVSVIVCRSDHGRFIQQYVGTAYNPVPDTMRHIIDVQYDISIHLCFTGSLAGRRAESEQIRFPDPEEAPIRSDSRVVSLPLLIDLKIARSFIRDLAAVVELIRYNKLTERFAGELDIRAGAVYLYCCEQATDEWYLGPQIG